MSKADTERLIRIEEKLDALIAALASEDEGEELESLTLDGEQAGGDRDTTQSLG